jgi:hypothetical protein
MFGVRKINGLYRITEVGKGKKLARRKTGTPFSKGTKDRETAMRQRDVLNS